MARILIFDSGMGGITIYDEVRKVLANNQFIYVFDNEFFPYSEKDEQTIIDRVSAICLRVNELYTLDMIIIACNTASTVVLPKLREQFNIPIIGTVPAVKPAAKLTNNHIIGILATIGTIKREYVQNLIHEFASECEVLKLGSTALVELAETKFYGNTISLNDVKTAVKPWLDKNLDAIVLGCTHFPIIKEELQQIFPNAKLVDSGAAIANRAHDLLPKNASVVKNPQHLMFATKEIMNTKQILIALKPYEFENINILKI